MKCLENAFGKIDIKDMREKLYKEFSFKSQMESNFISSKNSLICCFYEKYLFITDINLNPLLMYESTSYIIACSISSLGKYAICQMARNRENDEDSETMILFDVLNRNVIKRKKLEICGNDITHLCLEEQEKMVFVYVDDKGNYDNSILVKYDFELNADENTLRKYYKSSTVSPYVVVERIYKLIKDVKMQLKKWEDVKSEVLELFSILNANICISPNSLATAYEELGDVYLENNLISEAISAYETGILLNSKLPVKRKLSKLRKEYEFKEPEIPRIELLERKKAWEQDAYILPPTYDENWENNLEGYIESRYKILKNTQSYEDFLQSDGYSKLNLESKELIEALYQFLNLCGYIFIENLKMDDYKFVESINELNTMSDKQFNDLFNKMCGNFDINFQKESRKMAERIIGRKSQTLNSMTVREEIILNLYNMSKGYIAHFNYE